MKGSRFLCPALGLALLAGGCAPKIGPRPLLSQVRASKPNAEGTSTVWGRVSVHFKDAKPGSTAKALMEKLGEEVTFEVEAGGTRERYAPALVPTTVELAKTTDDTWQDKITVDFLLFPSGVGDGSVTVHATNYYQTAEDEPSYQEVAPVEDGRVRPKITRVVVEPLGSGKMKVTATLDRDAPPDLTVWHHLDGRVHRMQKKGSRLFFREYKDEGAKDHKVVMMAGETWISGPSGLSSSSPQEEESDEGGGAD